MDVCILLAALAAQEADHPWTRFPGGTRVRIECSSVTRGRTTAWTEHHRVDESGGRRSHAWSESRSPGEVSMGLVTPVPLGQALKPLREEAREKSVLVIGGEKIPCMRTEFRGERLTVRVWAAAEADVPSRFGRGVELLPRQVLQVESVADAGERRDLWKSRLVRRGVRLEAAGSEWLCDLEEVVDEVAGAGEDDRKTTTLRWLSAKIPGHVVREEAHARGPEGDTRLTRVLVKVEIPE